MKRLFAFAVILIMTTCFVSCTGGPPPQPTTGQHTHICDEWNTVTHASCTEDGEKEGVCTVCGVTVSEAIPAGHSWINADCENPRSCQNCGETEGEALGHEWKDADCENPRTCNNCNAKEGDALGHTYENGICSICNKYELGDPNASVTITFCHTMREYQQPILDKYIAAFNELYPNIQIQHKYVGSLDDIFANTLSQISIGVQPNIVLSLPEHIAMYSRANAIQALGDYIGSQAVVTGADGGAEIIGLTQAQIDAFFEGFYAQGSVYGDGKTYTLPFAKTADVLYFNETFFAANGLELPTTWAEMEDLCRRIKEIAPDCIPLGIDNASSLFITLSQQFGGEYVSATGEHYLFDNAENKAFVKMLKEWYEKGYITTNQIYGSYVSNLFVNIPSADNPTCSYMTIASSATASFQVPDKDRATEAYPFTVGIAPIPQVDSASSKVFSQGPDIAILKNLNPDEVLASWLFVKFLMTNADFQAEYSVQSGYMPVAKAATETKVFADYMANAENGNDYMTALSLKVALAQADAYFVPPAFVRCDIAREQVGYIIHDVLAFRGTEQEIDKYIHNRFLEAVDHCEWFD